jgi:Zn-dependent metalloprotease
MHRHDRCSIFCILPPHVLKNIAQNGSPTQRQKALDTLSTDQTLRAMRAAAMNPPGALSSAAARRPGEKNRTIYNANNGMDLPGTVVRAEKGGPSPDPAVNEAFDGLGATFDLYWQVFERDSIDDDGMPMTGVVHFGSQYNNAFWDGSQMVFGDGDGEIFNRFTIAVDVIGHELAHGVTEDEAGLYYFHQSGALNESLSDVFGTLVKQKLLNQTVDQADWLIGAGLLAPGVKGQALRSMKDPGSAYNDPVLGKDPQPGHMKDFVYTLQDNGGVHINSGIPNRAFYLIASQLGGQAWTRAGKLWYYTLRDPRIRRTSGFRAFARRTVANAATLYGEGSDVQKAAIAGWREVGIAL